MRIRSLSVLVALLVGFAACGEDAAVAPVAGKSGSSGGGGASGGAAASGGAGIAGALGGSAGSGTAGASGGSAGASSAGSGGAGQGGASAGTGGGAAGSAGCSSDGECLVPGTTPAGCAVGKCSAGACSLVAKDADGDGHATAVCKAGDGSAVKLGLDCDDANPGISPASWDGPADGAKPNRCGDGIDQDCSGKADDGKTAQGVGCTCLPGDVRACAEESSGKAIPFPPGPGGKPFAPCKLGSQTCQVGGTWSPCTDAVPPGNETCDEVDNDCNGTVDDVVGRGDACDVLGKAVGACKSGGKLSCAVSVNGKLGCKADDPRIGVAIMPGPPTEAAGWVPGFAPNGSGDWDCDGQTQESMPAGASQGEARSPGSPVVRWTRWPPARRS